MSEKNQLKVALIQTDIHWEQKQMNLNQYTEKIQTIDDSPDLIILPETFNTGFCMKKAALHAESMDGPTVVWMQEMAAQSGAVITGSCMISEKEAYYNRLLWVEPNGKISHYDKAHLFRLAYEQNYFSAGRERKIVNLKGWNICLNVCYDLRFPVWCRNQNDYDLLLFVANWPTVRIKHWKKLLKARAIENLSYVIGVNRIGLDGNDMAHNGHSAVIHPSGQKLISSKKEEIINFEISLEELNKYRRRFQFYKDADQFNLIQRH